MNLKIKYLRFLVRRKWKKEQPKIQWKNFKIWFKDQWERKRFFYNMFISRNAWGAFHINSHINQSTGQVKISYSLKSAQKSAVKMQEKKGEVFSYYKCLYCDGYHIGRHHFGNHQNQGVR